MKANKKLIYKIRKATASDRKKIKKLLGQFPKEVLMHHLPPVHDSVVVITHNGQIIGHGGLDISSTMMAEIRSLAVDKKFQGLGIASKIVEELEKLARKRKLWLLFADTVAIKFFKDRGYNSPKKGSEVLFKYFK